MNAPRLRAGVVIARAESGAWQVRWGFDGLAFVEGKSADTFLPLLLPALQGTSDFDESWRTLSATQKAQAGEILRHLDELGVLSRLSSDATMLSQALEATFPDPLAAVAALESIRPLVIGVSPLAGALTEALTSAGFLSCGQEADPVVATAHRGQVLPVFCIPDYPSSALREFNRSMLSLAKPWMIVGAWNSRLVIGPLFMPGVTACCECLLARFDSNRQFPQAIRELGESCASFAMAPREPVLPSRLRVAAALAASELFAHVVGTSCNITGRTLVHYPTEGRSESENVLLLPWCEACSGAC